MLNINQNFDLKAPVFNFDRDYFNSVDELNAYDTSNVPNHFVTNVAGMLYQFTKGKWLPMIGTDYNVDTQMQTFKIANENCVVQLMPSHYLYQYAVQAPKAKAALNSHAQVNLYSQTEDMPPQLNITLTDRINYSKSILCGQANGAFGLTIKDLSNHSASMLIDKTLTDEEQGNGYSPVDLSLTDDDYSANINAEHGFTHKTDDGFIMTLDGYALTIEDATGYNSSTTNNYISLNDGKHRTQICLHSDEDGNYLYIGSDEKFKFSRPINNEGGVISGIKSLTAFANPSATKVWATDGSTVDLSTKANVSDLDAKANKSDVLLKKSASGGYYIEANSNTLGVKAFAANNTCTASGANSCAVGLTTTATATGSHAEGSNTRAIGWYSHSEGTDTVSYAIASHAEGIGTGAIGYCSHTQGSFNVVDNNSIHSVGIGNNTIRKNAEYIYAKNNSNNTQLVDDPKNGYKYLIGVGGYDGISTDNTTYKSVQEVIADLTARIEQLETKVKALEDANTPA